MKPNELVKIWVEYFNQANAEKLANLYHEDAINHQVANKPIFGKQAIKEMFENEFSNAEMLCIVKTFLKMEIGQFWNGKIR